MAGKSQNRKRFVPVLDLTGYPVHQDLTQLKVAGATASHLQAATQRTLLFLFCLGFQNGKSALYRILLLLVPYSRNPKETVGTTLHESLQGHIDRIVRR